MPRSYKAFWITLIHPGGTKIPYERTKNLSCGCPLAIPMPATGPLLRAFTHSHLADRWHFDTR